MPVRQLIIAVLMLLSLSAQASAALLSCGGSGPATADCCDPLRQTRGCPSPDNASLSCAQVCSTESAAAGVSATLERDQQMPTLDPLDESAALAMPFYELLATVDPLEPVRQPVEPPVTRYPTNPTYLATARLRI
jgi:hypothetical protein